MDSIGKLLWLVRKERFDGAVLPDGSLAYLRWWSGALDAVIVHGEDETGAYRAYGVDPARPADMTTAWLDWKQHGPVVPVVSELLSLVDPPGVRISVRALDPDATAVAAAALAEQPMRLPRRVAGTVVAAGEPVWFERDPQLLARVHDGLLRLGTPP